MAVDKPGSNARRCEKRRQVRSAFLLLGAILSFEVGCASAPVRTPDTSLAVIVDGRSTFLGPAAYTVRLGGAEAARVVSLRRIGEILVTDEGCRFARLETTGLVSVWRHEGACAETRGDRVCFVGADFVDERSMKRARVDGCADRNELFLDRIEADVIESGLVPRTLTERCVDVPVREPAYLRIAEVNVDGNEHPWRGLRIRHDGDGFGVCFLSTRSGRFRIDLAVEDPGPRALVLQGDVDDL